MPKPKIFVFAVPCNEKQGIDPAPALDVGIENFHGDCVGYALAEDGEGLGSHLSSSIGWFRNDMGLTGNWKHDIYKKHYSDGYELVEIDGRSTQEEFVRAQELNKAKAETVKGEA